jgi:ribosomal protein S18 acetylase RimI-like enzyme
MTQIMLSKASVDDVKTVQAIGEKTFFETFGYSNSEIQMQQYLEENFSEVKVASELNNAGSIFYIAWDAGSAIGYLKVNIGDAQTELQDKTSLEIERIYVLGAYHGKKVGQMLYDKALEIAYSQKKDYIWLGVWEENPKAIRFYEKNGFVSFDKHIFRIGDDEQTDIMMKKIIV